MWHWLRILAAYRPPDSACRASPPIVQASKAHDITGILDAELFAHVGQPWGWISRAGPALAYLKSQCIHASGGRGCRCVVCPVHKHQLPTASRGEWNRSQADHGIGKH